MTDTYRKTGLQTVGPMKLAPAHSAYLDFVRFTAALAVLLGHMSLDGFDMSWIPLATLSHEAVIVFFVMSGFIIYSSTAGRGGSGLDYLVARASRIYSVALPAVLFCIALSLVVGWLAPQLIPSIPAWRPFSLGDIAGSLLFTSESWSSFKPNTALTLNGPYWSLCYEVWYYIVFGLYFFVRSAWRWPLVMLSCLIAGPQIVVLLPIWCLGAWMAAHRDSLPRLSQHMAWFMFIAGPLLIVAIKVSAIDQIIEFYLHNAIPGFWRLEGSQRLVTDHIVALAIAANLYAFSFLGGSVHRGFQRARPLLAWLAGFSFTLYLFHRPLTDIAGEVLPSSWRTVPASMLATVVFLVLCWLISHLTEQRLPVWRAGLNRMLRARRGSDDIGRPGTGAGPAST